MVAVGYDWFANAYLTQTSISDIDNPRLGQYCPYWSVRTALGTDTRSSEPGYTERGDLILCDVNVVDVKLDL